MVTSVEVIVISKLPPYALRALFCAITFSACTQPESAAEEYTPTNRRDGSVSDRDGGAPGDDASASAACSKAVDCMGVCGGSAVVDSCGVCNGNDASRDCAGVCGGAAKVDCSNVCNGPDAPDPYYVDADNDGLGDPKRKVELCSPTMGNVTNSDDCDDAVAGKCKPSLQLRFKRKQSGTAAIPYTKKAMTGLGDVDGDGVSDFAIGERIVFMNRDGSIKSSRRITSADLPGVTDLQSTFGSAVAALGDVDGNGVPDIAISEPKVPGDTRTLSRLVMGRVWTLLLNRSGAPLARSSQLFSVPAGVDPSLSPCRFVSWGSRLTSLDVNGDGKLELAVASSSDCDQTRYTTGRIELFTVANTGVLTSLGKISFNDGVPYTRAEFEVATLASAGDANGDGTADLFVATPGLSFSPAAKLWTMLLKPNGTLLEVASRLSAGDTGDAKLTTLKGALAGLPEVSNAPPRNVLISLPGLTANGGLAAAEASATKPGYRLFYPKELGVTPAATDDFGAAAASLGDLDGDGLPELSVLAAGELSASTNVGALYTLGFAADCSNQTLRGDCNASASDGCETTLTTDDNCGACGQSCTGAPNSTGGSCTAQGKCALTCAANFGDCNGDPRDGCETNLLTSVDHCNACGTACQVVNHRLPVCTAGACGSSTTACEGIWNNCNTTLSDGCESCGKCDQKTNIEDNYGAPVGTIPAAAPCAQDQICQEEFYRQNSSALSPPKFGRCLTKCPLGRADCDGNATNGCEANITLQSRCGGCGANNTCGVWEYLEYCVVNAAGTGYECR